ncbi:hypothetical protein ElyMa_000559000 [Elysia marginata]|uniref:Uncharacterized protein n=1 Tax=Elysia marginata TaxID=1093978 RepID=A0AAV4G3E8_9GAST|nr:hypothetical protein ElyMa_000559000 [Elysia marginata]
MVQVYTTPVRPGDHRRKKKVTRTRSSVDEVSTSCGTRKLSIGPTSCGTRKLGIHHAGSPTCLLHSHHLFTPCVGRDQDSDSLN